MVETKVYAIWAAVGPLVGVIIGGMLTAWWQRRYWILDNKKAEYRELVDALHNYRWEVTRQVRQFGKVSTSPDVAGPAAEGQIALAKAVDAVWRSLADRFFISKALVNSTIHQDMQNLDHDMSGIDQLSLDQWTKKWYELYGELRRMAWKDLGIRKRMSHSPFGVFSK